MSLKFDGGVYPSTDPNTYPGQSQPLVRFKTKAEALAARQAVAKSYYRTALEWLPPQTKARLEAEYPIPTVVVQVPREVRQPDTKIEYRLKDKELQCRTSPKNPWQQWYDQPMTAVLEEIFRNPTIPKLVEVEA